MFYVYGAFQVAMLIAWYTIWPTLSAWVIFIPALVMAAHFALLLGVFFVAAIVIGWTQRAQRHNHERKL